MMNVRTGIIQALSAFAFQGTNLSDLVGERISSVFAPANTPATLTWIVMTKIGGNETVASDGDKRLSRQLFQFTVGGPSKDSVDDVVRLLIQVGKGYEYTYSLDGTDHKFTFLHSDDRDEDWSPEARYSKASVDLEVWVNT